MLRNIKAPQFLETSITRMERVKAVFVLVSGLNQSAFVGYIVLHK